MSEWVLSAAAGATVGILMFTPGYALARACRLTVVMSLALGPALCLAFIAILAMLYQVAGIAWAPHTVLPLVAAALAFVIIHEVRGIGAEPTRCRPRHWVRGAPAWGIAAVLASACIAVGPIITSMGAADTPLQRWDALYHAALVQYMRETGLASTLTASAPAFSQGPGGFYPAGIHALIALVPGIPTVITINAAALVLLTVPWVLGLAAAAGSLMPAHRLVPWCAAALGFIAPASPLNEWVHLAALPNAAGVAALPGVLAFTHATTHRWPHGWRRRSIHLALIGCGVVGLGFAHPNVALAWCVIVGVAALARALTLLIRGEADGRAIGGAVVVAALSLAPLAAIAITPLGSSLIEYQGGLAVSMPVALGEIGLGLLTVWPMPLGVVLWAFAYAGLVVFVRRRDTALLAAAVVLAILYVDAAVDSPLGLSSLWYRGQDRIALMVTMIAVIAASASVVLASRTSPRRGWVAFAVVGLAITSVLSIPQRSNYADLNYDLDHGTRARYLDSEEWRALTQIAPTLDHDRAIVASPFSGGAHLYPLTGQATWFRTAGHSHTQRDLDVIEAAATAHERESCALLSAHGIGYIYVDAYTYGYGVWARTFTPLQVARLQHLGEPLMATEHSALYALECPSNAR